MHCTLEQVTPSPSHASELAHQKSVMAIIIVGAVAAILSCYPVVFFGRSFVSPNNQGSPLIYHRSPFHPGGHDTVLENLRNSDAGATMWEYMPYSAIQHRALFSDGELPFWNRYNSGGVPLLSQGVSMFGDPLHWIPVLAGGSAGSWDIKFVSAKILFAIGVGLLVLISTGCLPAAAVMSAVVPFIGFFTFRLNHPSFFSLCYAPWILCAWLWIIRADTGKGRAFWLFVLTLASWMELNSGTVKESYAILLFTHATGLAWSIFAPMATRERIRLLLVVGAWGMGFLLFSAPAWLNFITSLSSAVTLSDLCKVITVPSGLLLGFFDEIFYAQVLQNEWLLYPSANFLILLGTVWSMARIKSTWSDPIFQITCIGSFAALAIAFGFIPKSFIQALPFFNRLCHVGDIFSCVLLLYIFLLAGLGISAFLREAQSDQWIKHYIISMIIIGALIVVFYIYQNAKGSRVLLNVVSGGLSAILVLSVLLLPPAAKMLVIHRKWISTAGALTVLCLIIILFRNGMHVETGWSQLDHYVANPRMRADFSVPSPTLETLKHTAGEPFRAFGMYGTLFAGFTGTVGIEGINGPDPIMNPYYEELTDVLGFKQYAGWIILITVPELAKLERGLDVLNVRYVVSPHKAPLGSSHMRLVIRKDLDTHERPHAWPRAFYADTIIPYETAQDFARIVHAPNKGPLVAVQKQDLENVAGLENSAASKKAETIVPASGYNLSNNTTSFTINAPGPGVIALMESYIPDEFAVTVNRAPTQYFRVNHAFKGVRVDKAGSYHIVFTYRPKLWYWSLLLMVVGTVIIMAILVLCMIMRTSLSK